MNSQGFKYIFLDRDGVINEERPDDYVKSIPEFVFIKGAKEAIAALSQKFDRIFVVTNQRGIERGKMTPESLHEVHSYMISEIRKAGGRIDSIYFCSDVCSTAINRKPNIGMAFRAQADYPEVDFKESIMVGNSASDIEFGLRAGMYTILVGNKYPKDDDIYAKIDAYFENLCMFVSQIYE